MTHDEFIQILPENQRQFATELIEELSKIDGVKVYHTDADGGDLRVRIGENGRVLFTMYWQSRNEEYLCNCFVEKQYLETQPAFFDARTIETVVEPLFSSFRFKSNYFNTISALTALVRETVKRFHFSCQIKDKK